MDQFYWICPAACSYTNDNYISRAVFGDEGWIPHKGIVMWGIVHRGTLLAMLMPLSL